MELNAEKVKKALEIHTGILDMPCEECPYNCDAHDEICLDVLAADALALINSQEQRIGELAKENENLRIKLAARIMAGITLKAVNKKLEEGNERLRAENERYAELEEGCYVTGYKNIKADTVREMQERLKADAVTIQDHTGKLGVFVGVGNIDDVAREMLEGDNEN